MLNTSQNGQDKRKADILFRIAESYAQGEVVTKDWKKAVDYYQQAAALDHADALNALGRHYEDGSGVDQDLKQALYYYQRATILKHTQGTRNFVRCYIEGKGVDGSQEQRNSELCLFFVCLGIEKTILQLDRRNQKGGNSSAKNLATNDLQNLQQKRRLPKKPLRLSAFFKGYDTREQSVDEDGWPRATRNSQLLGSGLPATKACQ